MRSERGIRPPTPLLLTVLFASGAAALIYEVLWLRELGRLFGATAQAAAVTFGAFFLGLAAGSLAWGRAAERLRSPLRAYALLEIGVAGAAGLYFLLFELYQRLLPAVLAVTSESPGARLAVKLVAALLVLCPPAFLMGGTLPVLGQFMVRARGELGRIASLLYAVNTAGAAVGAISAGFLLPPLLGFRRTYCLAIGLNLAVGGVLLWWTRRQALAPRPSSPGPPPVTGRLEPGDSPGPALLWVAAAASGGFALALEVLWTRMFAQVLQNSVYTFAAILTVFLLALALGSALANVLCRLARPPRQVLFALLTASGLAVAATPLIFDRLSSGLELVGIGTQWSRYLPLVFARTAAVLLVPTTILGGVFPYLMKIGERRMQSAGRTIGQLAALNMTAAIVGSLLAGFVLLERLGLWDSIRAVAAGYLLLALATLPNWRDARARWAALPIAGLALLVTVFSYSDLEKVELDRVAGEELVELREGAHGTLAVIRRGDDLRMKVDNSYLLGTSLSTPNLRLQSWIPLALHPAPRSVFYLGMGTGITAGGGLDLAIERMVVTELNPDVISAAEEHFEPYLNGLFTDPRVDIAVEDGRNYLFTSRDRFDVIISDIFLTHRAGVGDLYTREHFELVREHLATGGLFAQWLPMFELSAEEFGMIARSMLEVFPEVSLWRRSFSPRFPVMALVGREAPPQQADLEGFVTTMRRLGTLHGLPGKVWFRHIPFAAYAGELAPQRDRFGDFEVNTDDRRPLEYLAPRVERDRRALGGAGELAGAELGDHCERILEGWLGAAEPPGGVAPALRLQAQAGLSFYRYQVALRLGRSAEAAAARARYEQLVAQSRTLSSLP